MSLMFIEMEDEVIVMNKKCKNKKCCGGNCKISKIKSIEVEANEFQAMLICSTRYAVGRSTYIVSDVVDLILKYWDSIPDGTRNVIVKSIESEIIYGNFGMEMDLKQWQKVLVRGREFCSKSDIDSLIKEAMDNG